MAFTNKKAAEASLEDNYAAQGDSPQISTKNGLHRSLSNRQVQLICIGGCHWNFALHQNRQCTRFWWSGESTHCLHHVQFRSGLDQQLSGRDDCGIPGQWWVHPSGWALG